MFSFLKRLTRAAPDRTRVPIDDPELGRLVWSDETQAWVARMATSTGEVTLELLGDEAPSAEHLQRARAIARDLPAFQASVRAFLENESRAFQGDTSRWRHVQVELESLELDSVCLTWPDPMTGMISFRGGSPDRLWRANISGSDFNHLSFDS